MKAVILAAGIGSRLWPLTSSKPKCLIKIAGKPILQHQIDALVSVGLCDIIIVVGYKSHCIREHCKHIRNANITLINNPDYENTNNMYSLYLAKNAISGESCILVNGDVVFDTDLVKCLINHQIQDFVACDVRTYNNESMKITINKDGFIDSISKLTPKQKAYATSIDLYCFSKKSSVIFFNKITQIIEQDKNLKDWTEVALDRLFQKQKLKLRPVDIAPKRWVEIDDYDDLTYADVLFSNFDRTLKNKKIVFLDLDGTVYTSNRIVSGTKSLLQYLDERHIAYYFLSNNSSQSKNDYRKKLMKMGIEADAGQIILSTDGTIKWLKEENVSEIYVVGTASMKQMFDAAGMNTDSKSPEYVVLGYDTELTYEKIQKAAVFLQNGADLIATHCDLVCPSLEGPIPDIGSMLAMFETALKIKPLKIFGKPNNEMVSQIIDRHKVVPQDVVLIGDRIYTDMELANRIGCDFICTLSGDTSRNQIEDLATPPALVVPSIGHIIYRMTRTDGLERLEHKQNLE